MKNQMSLKVMKFVGASLLSLSMMPLAEAQTTSAPAAGAKSNVFAECAQKSSITLPARGSGQKLSEGERETIKSCVKEERKAAFQSCASQANIVLPTQGSGQRLTKEERSTIRQCMASLGFKNFRHRHHKNSEPGQQQQQAPQST